MKKSGSIAGVILAVFLLAGTANAERKYIFGTSWDFMGGVANQIDSAGFSKQRPAKDVFPFFAVYPSFNFQSIGAHSTFQLDYAFVGQRYETDDPITTTAHSFTGTFDSQLGQKAHLRISNTFSSVPAISLLRALKDTITTPDGFLYVFEPNFYTRTRLADTARISLDIDLTEKSYLTFDGSGSYLNYEEDVSSTGFVSDQYREEGSFSFSHRSGKRSTWKIKYRMHQNQIEGYPNSRSHMATFGSDLELSPTVQLALEAGPSYTEKTDLYASYTGYFAYLRLSKQIHEHSAWIYYNHRPADSTGLGSITDSHQGGVGLSLALSHSTRLNLDARGYLQDQRKDVTFDFWGAEGTAFLSQMIGRHFFAGLGASYGIYEGQSLESNNPAYRQAFVSLGFHFPELWRSMK